MSWIKSCVRNSQRMFIWKINKLISSGGSLAVVYQKGLYYIFGWTRKSSWKQSGEGHHEADGYPLTLFTCACQTDDATGVTRCPSWIKAQSQVFPSFLAPQSFSLHISPSLLSLSFPSPSFLFHFLLRLLTSSQRSVGCIHRPDEGKSTAAKEKADMSVSLRRLSRWLLQ